MIDLITENEDAWKKYGFTVYPSRGDFVTDPSGRTRRVRAMKANLASRFLEEFPSRVDEFKNSNGKILIERVLIEAESFYWSDLPIEYRVEIEKDVSEKVG